MGFSDPAPPAALRVALAILQREVNQVLPPADAFFGGKDWGVSSGPTVAVVDHF